jgi:hypothetical protein
MKHGNAEVLQPYSVAAADAMHKIGTALISAALSLGERLSQTLPVPRKSYYQSVYCSYTAGTSL